MDFDKMKESNFVRINKKFAIDNVTEPNLYRDIFPYETVPRIPFDNYSIAVSPAKKFRLSDTTFRDGQQARPPYTIDQISKIFDYLMRLSGPSGIIDHSEFFLYTEKDREAVEVCRNKGYRFPRITSWIRANKKDFELVKQMELEETGILASVSDYHIFLKLGWTREDAEKNYLDIVYAALEQGIIPRLHLEDVTRADIYGFVVPFVQKLVKIMDEGKIPIRLRLCDTMGYGVTYPQSSLPRSVPKLIRAIIDDAGMPGTNLEWHGHNDFHRGFTNATYAWMYGCENVNSTLLGFGERTGNTPLEAMIIEYMSLTGDHSMDTTAITDMAHYFESIGFDIPANYPFVGTDFNVTRAGIHVDGIIKNEEIYNIFDTEKLLKRPLAIAITDKSGVAGVSRWVNSHLGLSGDKAIDKRDAGIIRMNQEIQKLYDLGRPSSMSNEELEGMAKKYLPQYFISDFDKIKERQKNIAITLLKKYLVHPAIISMLPEDQEDILRELIQKDPFICFAYVVNSEGQKITKHITQITDKSKYDKNLIDDDYSDRDWFIEAMRTGQTYISPVFSSKITERLTVTVSGAIVNEEGVIVGVLGLDFIFEDFAKVDEESVKEEIVIE